jgi:GH35 family endo-1,4-beta-xylanase
MNIPSTDELDHRIQQHRTASVTVTLTHNGAPVAGQDVVVAQKSHKFLFGTNWGHRSHTPGIEDQDNVALANASSLINWDHSSVALANNELSGEEKELAELHHAHFIKLFNQVTLPFYWGGFEPVRGQPQTERLLNAARWFKGQGCEVKGHPLCWQTVTADWLLPMSNAEILAAQLARIQREVGDFAGVIDTWDVINEAVIMPVYEKYDNGITRIARELGRIELIRCLFETARAANPNATLLINDFDTSSAYDILVEGCLAAGLQFDVIGIQSHMHKGYWGVEKTWKVLDHFERFNLPIHFTENSFLSGHLVPTEVSDLQDYMVDDWPSTPEGEARQVEQVITHYKTLLAHPSVQAITWWDMSDGAWLNAPAGLLRRDQSPKPAYDALFKLVKGEWWLSPTTITTDAHGQFTFAGFLGDYSLVLGDDSATFSLSQTGDVVISVNV